MELNEVMLVIVNDKGVSETNLLCTRQDYADKFLLNSQRYAITKGEIVENLLNITSNAQNPIAGFETMYFGPNHTVSARMCTDTAMLSMFLSGRYNDTPGFHFNKDESSKPCLDVVSRYALHTDGTRMETKELSFVKVSDEPTANVGETVTHLSGKEYMVIEKLTPQNLLLMDMAPNYHEIVLAVGAAEFERFPKEQKDNPETYFKGIEWAHGNYLGFKMADIDMDYYMSKYGPIEDLEESPEEDEDEPEPSVWKPRL